MIHKVEIKAEESGEPVKIKQITCGAVFSVALSCNGEVYAWGSNNNGQMAATTNNASSDSSIQTSSVQISQLNLPTKIDLERDSSHGIIKQVLAGDCHVFVIDDGCIYAWGQG